jgi:hypothetical protein
MQDIPYLRDETKQILATMGEMETNLTEKRRLITVNETLIEALDKQEPAIKMDEEQPLRAHIQHAYRPYVKQTLRFSGLAEIWAGVSIGLMIGLMMIAVVVLFLFARQFLLVGLSGMLLVLLTIEASFRRCLWALVRGIAIALAIAAFLICYISFSGSLRGQS